MIVEAKCKFCHKPLHLEVDDEYANLGDPFNLLKGAACGPCAKYMTASGRVLDLIRKLCSTLQIKTEPEARNRQVDCLRDTLKTYLKILADRSHHPVPEWDEAILQAMLRNLKDPGSVLERMKRLFPQKELL